MQLMQEVLEEWRHPEAEMLRILFVDDDKVYSRVYEDALGASGFYVERVTGPIDAISKLDSGREFDLFIIDLMMPAQGVYSDTETRRGLYTGACLTSDLHVKAPTVPKVIFTLAHSDYMIQQLRVMLSAVPNFVVMRKAELSPTDFANAIMKLIDPDSRTSKSLFQKIADSVILQPNVAGVGVDIRKLLGIFNKNS